MGLRAGTLDRRIVIQRPTETRAAPLYESQKSWANLLPGDGKVWASVRPANGKEVLSARELGAEVTTVFQIRFSRTVAPVDPTYRLIFDEREYGIVYAREIERREGIELLCVARGEGGIPVPAIGQQYTLVAETGEYVLSGQIAGSSFGFGIAAGVGIYALSGQAVGVFVGRRMSTDAGSYDLTGQFASLRAARRVAADVGTYSVSGQAAGLRAARSMAAVFGTYALAGQAVTFRLGKTLVGGTGTYTLSGQAAALRLSRKFVANVGTYALTGQAATLTYDPLDKTAAVFSLPEPVIIAETGSRTAAPASVTVTETS